MKHENYDCPFETTSVRNFARWFTRWLPAVYAPEAPEADQRDR